MEFELRPDGRLRYANNSNYKKDTIIRKEVRVSPAVLAEFKRIIAESEILEYVRGCARARDSRGVPRHPPPSLACSQGG